MLEYLNVLYNAKKYFVRLNNTFTFIKYNIHGMPEKYCVSNNGVDNKGIK